MKSSPPRISVAYQGERGAYSEEASLRFFKKGVELRTFRTLPEVFRAVESKAVDYGVVPIENSIEGSVTETYDLLLSSKLMVMGEVNLRIVHCLISNEGTKIEDLEAIYSHPQALAQCRKFLGRLSVEVYPSYDTAGSVRLIKEKKLVNAAAIASMKAAEIYKMKVLAKGIEDAQTNYTRFFVLSDKDSHPTNSDKTSIIFSASHIPGSLYKALGEFASRQVNLTKIESRPTKVKPWEYNFYLDFEGHRSDQKSSEALESLRRSAFFVKVLGSYPKAEVES